MGLHEDLQAAWGTTEFLGPVPTDFKPKDLNSRKTKVKLVIVCESPSDDEVDLTVDGGEAIRPANGNTGTRIAKAVATFDAEGAGATRDNLPRMGYYLTNLVRYRANVGLKTKYTFKNKKTGKDNVNRTKVHAETMERIAALWADTGGVGKAVREEIITELTAVVNANPKVKILFACGVDKRLSEVVLEVVSKLPKPEVDWVHSMHPSGWEECHYLLIDPNRWDDMAKVDHCSIRQRCARLEKLLPKRAKTAKPTTTPRKRTGGAR